MQIEIPRSLQKAADELIRVLSKLIATKEHYFSTVRRQRRRESTNAKAADTTADLEQIEHDAVQFLQASFPRGGEKVCEAVFQFVEELSATSPLAEQVLRQRAEFVTTSCCLGTDYALHREHGLRALSQLPDTIDEESKNALTRLIPLDHPPPLALLLKSQQEALATISQNSVRWQLESDFWNTDVEAIEANTDVATTLEPWAQDIRGIIQKAQHMQADGAWLLLLIHSVLKGTVEERDQTSFTLIVSHLRRQFWSVLYPFMLDAVESLMQEITEMGGILAKPHWDAATRTLYLNGEVIKTFTQKAERQVRILVQFEEEHWPTKIIDPITKRADGRQVLSDALRRLNTNGHITFQRDGTGEGILWRLADSP